MDTRFEELGSEKWKTNMQYFPRPEEFTIAVLNLGARFRTKLG
jgi:hypothetical protein